MHLIAHLALNVDTSLETPGDVAKPLRYASYGNTISLLHTRSKAAAERRGMYPEKFRNPSFAWSVPSPGSSLSLRWRPSTSRLKALKWWRRANAAGSTLTGFAATLTSALAGIDSKQLP